jgi:aspartate dehydrogenase
VSDRRSAERSALGAIAGLDGLKGAAVDGHLDTIVMETRKPPRGLAGAPGVSGLDLTAITAPTLFFEGTAREACRAFPANVNVVAAVSLAGLGPDRTCSRIHADPSIDRNRRTVTPEDAFGRLRVEIENVPSGPISGIPVGTGCAPVGGHSYGPTALRH